MYYTIHANDFGDVGQEIDTLEDAQVEAADMWVEPVFRREGARLWSILSGGKKVGEIHAAE